MASEEYEELLGTLSTSGGYGSVRKVKRKSDDRFLARKQIRFSLLRYASEDDFRNRVEREVALMKRLEHPNIVKYYAFERIDDLQYNIYMEFCEGRTLEGYVAHNRLTPNWPSPEVVWSLVYQLSAAVTYCHSGFYRLQSGSTAIEKDDKLGMPRTEVLHRDIKPGNVLLYLLGADRFIVKLCDFGLGISRYPGDENQMSYGGTTIYIAPEVTEDNPQWSTKADMFSLGSAPLLDRYGAALIDLTTKCIDIEPALRLESNEVFQEAYSHVRKGDIILSCLRIQDTAANDATPTVMAPASIDGLASGLLDPGIPNRIDRPSSAPADLSAPEVADAGSDTQTNNAGSLSENARQRQNSGSELHRTAAAPNSVTSFQDSLTVSTTSNLPQVIREGLGSLVGDFKRILPPDTCFPGYTWGDKISFSRLTDAVAFRTREQTISKAGQPNTSSNAMSSGKSSRHVQKLTTVEIKATSSNEYQLRRLGDYLEDIPFQRKVTKWMWRKHVLGKKIYMVLGYITYENATVIRTTADESIAPKRGVVVEGGIGAGLPRNSMSNATDHKLEKSGEHIQAVYLQQIQFSGIGPMDGPSNEVSEVGDTFTHYFWGPKRHPVSTDPDSDEAPHSEQEAVDFQL